MVERIGDKSEVYRFGRLLGRIMLIVIGALMASIMAIAGCHEIVANNFFGASVSLMVVVFGFQLMSIGIRGSSSKTRDTGYADPLEELWHSDKRIDLIRPSHGKMEIRGRD